MVKSCPVNKDHAVEERKITDHIQYDLCTVCDEDVEYLGRDQGLEWNYSSQEWVVKSTIPDTPPLAPPTLPRNDLVAEDAFETEDEDFTPENFYNGLVEARNADENRPPTTIQSNFLIYLVNNNEVCGEHVITLLEEAFGKTRNESIQIALSCHENGRALVMGCENQEEVDVLLQAIENAKRDIMNDGEEYSATIAQLEFNVEARNQNN